MIRASRLLKELPSYGDQDRAHAMQQYMRGKFLFYGIASPLRKEVTKEYIRESRKMTVEEIVQDASLWWSDPHRESQYIGTDLLIRNKKRLGIEELEFIESLITIKSWWDTVDALASHIIGSIFERFKEERDTYITRWLDEENIWLNRTCLLFQLKYGKGTEVAQLTTFILKLKHKDEFFIQKAIGWSLRQCGKFYPEEVTSFLEKTELSNLAYKEASRLLPDPPGRN